MPPSTAQLQQENQRLKSRCETLETELTELQQRYQTLGRSEARYRQVVENSPISISFLSADGQHVEANAAFERMMGFTVEDSQRIGFNIFTDPALEANGTRPYMLRAMAGETVIEPPTNFYDASQLYGKEAVENYTPGQGHYFPIWNEDGEVQEIVEMAPMVTDLLQAQAATQAERERAAAERAKLLSTVAQVANLLLRSQDYTTVMPDVVRLLGEAVGCDRCEVFRYDAKSGMEDATMQFLSEWCSSGTLASTDIPFDLQAGFPCRDARELYEKNSVGEVANFLVDNLQDPLKQILEAQGTKAVLSVPITTADGWWGAVTFDNCAAPRLFDEAEIAILQVAAESIATAIERQQQEEALRESEARFRELFENSNDGIYFCHFDEVIPLSLPVEEQVDLAYQSIRLLDANPAFANMYGFEQSQEVIGKHLGEIHAPDSNHRHLICHLAQSGWNISHFESDDVDETGKKRYWLSHLFTTIEDNCTVRGWGIVSNITELRQTQQALLEAEQSRAQELERYNAELQQTLEQLQARDRVLNATTESVAAILTDNEFERSIDNALAIIGASVDCDRVEVFQHIEDDTEQSLGVLRLLFEWHSGHTNPQQVHPILTEITQTGLEGL